MELIFTTISVLFCVLLFTTSFPLLNPVYYIISILSSVVSGILIAIFLLIILSRKHKVYITIPKFIVPDPNKTALSWILGEQEIEGNRNGKKGVLFSPAVDGTIDEIITLIWKDFISPWHSMLLKDSELHQPLFRAHMWITLTNLRERLKSVNEIKFITQDVAVIVTQHLEKIRLAQQSPDGKFILSPYLANSKRERQFVSRICELLLALLLPQHYCNYLPLRHLLREVLTNQVLQPTIERVCDPDWINETLLNYLKEKQLKDSDMEGEVPAVPGPIMGLIHKAQTPQQLNQLKIAIMAEIIESNTLANNKNCEDNEQDTEALQLPDLSEYMEQLKRAEHLCKEKMNTLKSAGVAFLEGPEDSREEISGIFENLRDRMCSGDNDVESSSDVVGPECEDASYLRLFEHLTHVKRKLDEVYERVNSGEQTDFLETEMSQLDRHLNITQAWISHLGPSSLRVLACEITEEKENPLFSIEVQLSISTESEPGTEGDAIGWTVQRQLTELQQLHNRLCVQFPQLKGLELPPSSRPFFMGRGADKTFLDKAKAMLQKYVESIMEMEKVRGSEPLYVFLVPYPEHLLPPEPPPKRPKTFLANLFKSDGDEGDEMGSGDLLEPHSSSDLDAVTPSEGEEPIYALLGELFDLRGVFRWLRRTLITFVQIAYGSSINRHLADTIGWLFLEPQLLMYLRMLRDSFWPGGKLASPSTPRSPELKEVTAFETRKSCISHLIPEELVTLVGQHNARSGALKLFETLQDPTLNKQLLYNVVEAFVYEFCPELKGL